MNSLPHRKDPAGYEISAPRPDGQNRPFSGPLRTNRVIFEYAEPEGVFRMAQCIGALRPSLLRCVLKHGSCFSIRRRKASNSQAGISIPWARERSVLCVVSARYCGPNSGARILLSIDFSPLTVRSRTTFMGAAVRGRGKAAVYIRAGLALSAPRESPDIFSTKTAMNLAAQRIAKKCPAH